ncbi:MAG: glutamine amidotransferase [Patescibacteria group bacterium]|uniref:Lipid II isoglutaminyl synthase (glutamine-hydrolyzing) subunit GatD n=1 Tax=candidate division WWE3 bacterium TaxID=2053526 RepID=A0A955ECB6_UNCKA|nr:glutamine amidotransferase [candidate division WWE3 bacterium]
MTQLLRIGYLYPKELNLYGDTGNIEVLSYRAHARNIDVEVIPITMSTPVSTALFSKINFLFMGGGPDSSQEIIFKDFFTNKGKYLLDYIHMGGVGVYICGAYQLLGNYYKDANDNMLKGLGAFNMHTVSFGKSKPRCIGNVSGALNTLLLEDPVFMENNPLKLTNLVGFENHGGRSYLDSSLNTLLTVKKGSGNNGEDLKEGLIYKNSFGTYLHGPLLTKNPHFADYLISKSLGGARLKPLVIDELIYKAHKNALTLPR